MKLYKKAVMLSGQFFLVLQHDNSRAKPGEIVIQAKGKAKDRGVFVNHADVPANLKCVK